MLEETGFDISPLIDKNEFIESIINDQLVRLYVISGIKMDTKFQPRTRNEIKYCEWFPLADLPSSRKDQTPKLKIGKNANAFFMVLPFIKRLKRWVFEQTQNKCQQTKRQRYKSAGDAESSTNKTKVIKQPQQFGQALSAEIQAFEDFKLKNAHIIQHSANKVCIKRGSEKKPNSKRQLLYPEVPKKVVKPKEEFTAPSWLNFKFNKQLILDCLP